MTKPLDAKSTAKQLIRPTPKRYFILFMFVLLIGIKSFQWILFASITNVIASFYHVDNIMVNWMAVVFMITFLTLALPISWLSELIGLRRAVIIGAIGTSIGLIIKCFSCREDGFYIAFIGHVVIGLVEPFFYSAYSQLATVWFPDDQVSMATSIGVMGDTLGLALAFIIPVSMVGDDLNDTETIQAALFHLFLANALLCSTNTILILAFFDEQPEHAPGLARLKQIEQRITSESCKQKLTLLQDMREFISSLAEYFKDRNFNLMHMSFGINIGTGYAIHTILNQIIAGSDPGLHYSTLVVGRAGLILLTMGIFGSVACGAILDKYRAYKSTTILVYLLALVSLIAFTLCLKFNQPIMIYLTIGAFGFFATGYECCGFEYAVELTYPKPEQISATLLNISGQIYGIYVTFVGSIIVDTYGSSMGCWFLCLSLALGLFLSFGTSFQYKRQQAVCDKQIQLELKDIH